MDGIITPILERLRALEELVFGPVGNHVFDPAREHVANNPVITESAPAQTVDPRRMPANPGMPMAPFDPSVHYEPGTQDVIDAENEAKANPQPVAANGGDGGPSDTGIVPDDIGADPVVDDPTLNEDGTPKRRRKGYLSSDD